ncbi:MAG TPA: hypothetical protein VKT82_32160 [Ktedonobacterales bacterium]|nr:hypothetical protein [Ktedonobacterales bacterium]
MGASARAPRPSDLRRVSSPTKQPSSQLGLLRLADGILVLKDGQLEANGRLEDLLTHSEDMQRLSQEPR